MSTEQELLDAYVRANPLGALQTFTNQNVPSPPIEGWRSGHGEPPYEILPIPHHEDVKYTLHDVARLCGAPSTHQVVVTLLRGICQSDIELMRAIYAKGTE